MYPVTVSWSVAIIYKSYPLRCGKMEEEFAGRNPS
jgi:hypothetical protein